MKRQGNLSPKLQVKEEIAGIMENLEIEEPAPNDENAAKFQHKDVRITHTDIGLKHIVVLFAIYKQFLPPGCGVLY